MVMPHTQPALGSRPRLYRLIRDTAYYVSGTVVCLNEDEVNEIYHERIHVHLEPEVEQLIADMKARLDRLDPPAEPAQIAADAPLALPSPEGDTPPAEGAASPPPAEGAASPPPADGAAPPPPAA